MLKISKKNAAKMRDVMTMRTKKELRTLKTLSELEMNELIVYNEYYDHGINLHQQLKRYLLFLKAVDHSLSKSMEKKLISLDRSTLGILEYLKEACLILQDYFEGHLLIFGSCYYYVREGMLYESDRPCNI